jgi:hypothetical protein
MALPAGATRFSSDENGRRRPLDTELGEVEKALHCESATRVLTADFHRGDKPHTLLDGGRGFQGFSGGRVRFLLSAFTSIPAFLVSASPLLRPFASIIFPLLSSPFVLRGHRFPPGGPIGDRLVQTP